MAKPLSNQVEEWCYLKEKQSQKLIPPILQPEFQCLLWTVCRFTFSLITHTTRSKVLPLCLMLMLSDKTSYLHHPWRYWKTAYTTSEVNREASFWGTWEGCNERIVKISLRNGGTVLAVKSVAKPLVYYSVEGIKPVLSNWSISPFSVTSWHKNKWAPQSSA